MMKSFAPVGIAAFGLLGIVVTSQPSQAARCPAGQIYRVSLRVCASGAENLKYMHHPRNYTAARPAAKPIRDAEVAALRPAYSEPEPVAAEPAAEPLAPAPPASPFGALPSALSFH